MIKYGVDENKAKELVDQGLAKDQEEAIVKVASGEADKLLNKKKENADGRGSEQTTRGDT